MEHLYTKQYMNESMNQITYESGEMMRTVVWKWLDL